MRRPRLPRQPRFPPGYPADFEQQETQILNQIAGRRKAYMDQYQQAENQYANTPPASAEQAAIPRNEGENILGERYVSGKSSTGSEANIVNDLFR